MSITCLLYETERSFSLISNECLAENFHNHSHHMKTMPTFGNDRKVSNEFQLAAVIWSEIEKDVADVWWYKKNKT